MLVNLEQSAPITEDNETVKFWRPKVKNGIFSNFYHAPVKIKGKIWPTNEHYFQAQKFEGTQKEENIRKYANPNIAFKEGRKRSTKFPIRSDWGKIKEEVMKQCCYAKFTQHENLKNFLLLTKDLKLIEASPQDAYWGWGPKKDGKNRLGVILMEVREKIIKEQNKIK